MTNQEVIATFMEPDAPENGGRPNVDVLKKYSPKGWWRYCMLSCNWKRPVLEACDDKRQLLGLLWEVEERLTDEQWLEYSTLVNRGGDPNLYYVKRMLHANPEQKIEALGVILLPLVEGAKK